MYLKKIVYLFRAPHDRTSNGTNGTIFFSLNLLDQNVYLVHKYRVGLIMDV